jgi:competence ComEA-like helix-hairpin-helix protein
LDTSKNSLIPKLQTILGVTKSEIIVVTVIFFGLFAGLIIQLVSNNKNDTPQKEDIQFILDSIAEAQRTTYVGTDMNNNPDPELVKGDTIVKKESFFPESKKKEAPSDKIDINNCSKVQLLKLPGVGEATAMKIVDYRKQHAFEKPEDIMNVKGIGPKKYEKMKDFIFIK